MKFLQNEVDEDQEEIEESSEDHEFNERRGFYSSPPYKPTYHYEPPAYHPPPPPPAYKAVYEVSVSVRSHLHFVQMRQKMSEWYQASKNAQQKIFCRPLSLHYSKNPFFTHLY